MLEKILKLVMAWCVRHNRVLDITGTGGPTDLYLRRYYVIKSKYLNVFIHQFFRSDRDDMHDHPWDFCTYLVRGAYTEKKWNGKTNQIDVTRRANLPQVRIGGFDCPPIKHKRLVFRKAEDQHQVLTDRAFKADEADQVPLTVCITGRSRREWGFVKEVPCEPYCGSNVGCNDLSHGTRVWYPWREYLGLPPDTPGRG